MMMARFPFLILALASLSMPVFFSSAWAQSFQPKPGESARAFEERAAGAPSDDGVNILPAKWNGRPYLFVDFPAGRKDEDDRDLVALAQMPDGSLRRIFVTTGEEEGGEATIAAIGFGAPPGASSDDLIVLLSWPVQHAIVDGTLYEVRLFADPGTATELTSLDALAKHFNHDTCDCDRPGEKSEHFPFKTMAAIKAELKKLKS
jgi:hypothetical protein